MYWPQALPVDGIAFASKRRIGDTVTRTPCAASDRYFPKAKPAIATVTGQSFVQTLSVLTSKNAIGLQVGVLEAVDPDDVERGGGEDVGRVGDLDLVHRRRLVEAAQVGVEPEDGRAVGGLVGAHPLEDAGAVMQTVGQDVHLRLVPGHELAVEPDFFGRCEPHSALDDNPARRASAPRA